MQQATQAIASEVHKEQPASLVEMVTAVLAEARHPNPQFWLAGLHPHAFTSPDVKVRRFLINRQWQLIFGEVPPEAVPPSYAADQLDARFCLLENGEVEDWINSFRNGVVPCLMKYNLPLVQH